MSLSQSPYSLILILQMLIHSVPQVSREGDVIVKINYQVHPTKYSLSMEEDVPVNLSPLLTVSVTLQVAQLKLIQHALQALRLMIAVSLSLWTDVGEDVHVRDPIVIAVDSPLAKCLNSGLPVILFNSSSLDHVSVRSNITSACV